MMTAKESSDSNLSKIVPGKVYPVKKSVFFQILKQPRYSGKVILRDSKQTSWVFYLYLGTIIYAYGGLQPVRRWRRNLAKYFPKLPSPLASSPGKIDPLALEKFKGCWEYYLLCLWVQQQKITLPQATAMIQETILEALFDIIQAVEITCQIQPEQPFITQLIAYDGELMLQEAQKLWWSWQNAKIADRCPDHAPIIVQPEALQQETSPGIYQTLTQLLDGNNTLRDLAVRMKRDTLTVMRSLLPYIQLGFIRLIEIPDLPSPFPNSQTPTLTLQAIGIKPKPLIACIDDSPLICQSMKQLLTHAGYDFLGINDPLRAIPTLLNKKPDFIFLDLVMPKTNGYEICSQLRKISTFRKTPIVILTGNDGIIDRMRAKLVGSSDFINKPVQSETVLAVIRKHLKEKDSS